MRGLHSKIRTIQRCRGLETENSFCLLKVVYKSNNNTAKPAAPLWSDLLIWPVVTMVNTAIFASFLNR